MRIVSHIYRNLSLTLLLLLSVHSYAQRTVVVVTDEQTSEPCIYTNVVLTTPEGLYIDAGATDEEGSIEFDLEREANVSVSFVGYQTFTGTIRPGETLNVELKTDLISMEAVVVTGQHQPKKVDESIYKIDVVDSRIMQERGVNNLAEALSNETSIRLSLDPATGMSIQMQGMSGENIKYLVDGVPLTGRVRGNIDLEQINMENIDHIEIVKGPMAVQYGTGAIAGVINIITKKNQYFRNLVKANTYIDHKGKYNFGLYGSAIRGKNTFTLSGNRSLFQGKDIDLNVDEDNYPDGHDRYMEYKPKRVYNAEAEYAFRKENLRINVKSQFMNSLLKDYANYTVGLDVKAYDSDYLTSRSTNSISISDQLSDKASYNIIGAYTWFGRKTHHITSDLHYLTHEVTDTTDTQFNNIMTRGSFSFVPGEKLSLLAGWDINLDNGKGDKIEEDAEIGDYAMFISGQIIPLRKLTIQPGLRLIYNTKYGAPLIPSLNLHWSILDNLGYRISYARGFRAPSLKELYMDFKDSNHDIFGNKNLEAETTNSFNTSFTYSLSGTNYSFKLEPSGFYNIGQDVITLKILDGQSNSATYDNLGSQKTIGGEANASFRHARGWSVIAGFSRIGETYDESSTGDWTPIIYYNNYNLSTKYTIRRTRTVVNVNLKYYGETPRLASLPEEQGGGIYQVFTQPYGDLEATVTQRLWKNRLTLVVGGKNLLNYLEGVTTGYQAEQEIQYNPLYYGRVWFMKLNLRLMN